MMMTFRANLFSVTPIPSSCGDKGRPSEPDPELLADEQLRFYNIILLD